MAWAVPQDIVETRPAAEVGSCARSNVASESLARRARLGRSSKCLRVQTERMLGATFAHESKILAMWREPPKRMGPDVTARPPEMTIRPSTAQMAEAVRGRGRA